MTVNGSCYQLKLLFSGCGEEAADNDNNRFRMTGPSSARDKFSSLRVFCFLLVGIVMVSVKSEFTRASKGINARRGRVTP